ncbi:BA14K family protein [Shinella sp. YE25]|uniref:BA14K family protein n=1 Tax=unclassified Shinella TaxID=2643062 RepID=UPI003FA78C54|nr:BA14K family protein [Shinella sp. YE25]
MKKLSIIAIAIATVFSGLSPALAAPMSVPFKSVIIQSDVQQVQDRREWLRGGREVRRDRRDRREVRRPGRDRQGWYNGQRGYREHRRGYRRHNDGWWYPLAAFGAGAIIGGAMSQPSTSYGGSHVQWCADRYRTYRASDNTYVPRAGVRAYCNSPYN